MNFFLSNENARLHHRLNILVQEKEREAMYGGGRPLESLLLSLGVLLGEIEEEDWV